MIREEYSDLLFDLQWMADGKIITGFDGVSYNFEIRNLFPRRLGEAISHYFPQLAWNNSENVNFKVS